MTTTKPRLGDGIAGLRALAAGSADLVLSDLPSGETEAEFDHAPDLALLFAATWHALKPDGVAVFMASSLRFAAACMAEGGKAYRYDLIWEKSRATGHLGARLRPMRAHEYALVFSRKAGAFFPQMWESGKPQNPSRKREACSNGENYGGGPVRNLHTRDKATDRFPRSVLRFAGVDDHRQRSHPQQKPSDLLRWLVRSYSRPGDLVVDPFAGSGSALAAAETEGRRAIGWDSSPRFGVAV